MRTFANRFCLFFTLLPLFARAAVPFPGGSGEIRVKSITPALKNDSLVVSATFENLFSPKIVGTIQSGLPSIIQIEMRLLDAHGRHLGRKFLTRNIEFDIWEEKYMIRENGHTRTFLRFEEVQKEMRALSREPLATRRVLRAGATYTVQLRVGIIPISARQAGKVTDWLQDPNQTEERLASENRTSGFELNINKLVSYFIGKKKGSRYISGWFKSQPFRLDDLRP